MQEVAHISWKELPVRVVTSCGWVENDHHEDIYFMGISDSITKLHNLGGLEQQTFTLSWLRRLKGWNQAASRALPSLSPGRIPGFSELLVAIDPWLSTACHCVCPVLASVVTRCSPVCVSDCVSSLLIKISVTLDQRPALPQANCIWTNYTVTIPFPNKATFWVAED